MMLIRKQLMRVYDSIALSYHSKRVRPWTPIVYRAILCLKPNLQSVIVDVGCGHGYIAGYLRAKGAEVLALDIDPTVLKEQSIKSYFIRGDAQHLPVRDETLDFIIAFEVIEHLKNPDMAISEFYRCLKKGGVLLLTTPTPRSPAANYPEHVSIRSRKAWIKALESTGFIVKIITYRYPFRLPYAPKMLNLAVGWLLGLYKRYLSVTSAKLLCVKK